MSTERILVRTTIVPKDEKVNTNDYNTSHKSGVRGCREAIKVSIHLLQEQRMWKEQGSDGLKCKRK